MIYLKKDVTNPKFKMDLHINDKPLKTEELMELVEKASPFIQGKFRKYGFITTDDYEFITMANFDLEKNCALNADDYPNVIKNHSEKEIAEANLLAVQEYFRKKITTSDVEVEFHSGSNSSRCVLVNIKRKDLDDIEETVYSYLYA